MQHKYVGLAIAMLACVGTVSAWGGDREIAEQIMTRLKESRQNGELKDFTLDMKVDKGKVLFRGKVSQPAQKQLVLAAAKGIDGIVDVVDEVNVTMPTPATTAKVVNQPMPEPITENRPAKVTTPDPHVAGASEPTVAKPSSDRELTLGQALAAEVKSMEYDAIATQPAGEIRPTAAFESTSDQQIVAGVVNALQTAKQNGQLRGFGVDVKSKQGVLQLTGRAGSVAQRDQIVRIAQGVPGVSGVRESIRIPAAPSQEPSQRQVHTQSPIQPQSGLQPIAGSNLTPLNPPAQMAPAPTQSMPVRSARRGTPAQTASSVGGMSTMTAPYRMPDQHQAPVQAIPAGMGMGYTGAPVAGQPVPMAPYSPAGTPRYDSPNLPNYAWPGYSSYPNYAALSYPQQYSPSAWPYIGPFYPYPQVPLGWRKISLEWDDGWWYLDFTEK